MLLKVRKYTYLILVLIIVSCANSVIKDKVKTSKTKTLTKAKSKKPLSKTKSKSITNTKRNLNNIDLSKEIVLGSDQPERYISLLNGKNVAVVGNQTSILSSKNSLNAEKHLVDVLISHKINLIKVFSPEHGFRGKSDAGEIVKNGVDSKTGLPITSLYGKNKKPTKKQLEGIDVVVFDLQDVGVRFYTYISTLHYIMEACAEQKIKVIVLDRPNPNAHYIDGTVLNTKYKSFIGMHPVPVVYGMTIGEYAKMINGEKWLKKGIQCNLTVIPLLNYTHKRKYKLPIKPSPNLPNSTAVNLYPSLCFFEGTTVSCGRGTDKQFQIYGSPYFSKRDFKFTPKPNDGSKFPKHKNRICYGENLKESPYLSKINLNWLINTYKDISQVKTRFWGSSNLFTKLAGNELLQKQISLGFTEKEIRRTWQKDLEKFMPIRFKYLIYK